MEDKGVFVRVKKSFGGRKQPDSGFAAQLESDSCTYYNDLIPASTEIGNGASVRWRIFQNAVYPRDPGAG